MVEWGRVRERAQAWAPDAEARPWRLPTWRWATSPVVRAVGEQARRWALAEVGPGRLVPWLAVAFGLGIAAYFTVDQEPSAWAAGAATVLAGGLALLLRNRPVAFPLVLGLAVIAAGFATATFKSAWVSHPVLRAPAFNVAIAGFVETREERERTDRIVVRVHRIEGSRLPEKPERVRLAVRKGTAPAVGSFVELKARLSPPLAPLRPGGYDFARDLYFQGIGATGFVLGAIRSVEAPEQASLWLRGRATMQGFRDAIDARIRAAIPGDAGAIASALITGKRDAISASVNEAMYVSSLAHVLSISGYHMAVVAAIVFFAIRAVLALAPTAASRYPIKKWAAFVALVVAGFYLLMSGAEVATQRAFIMIAIVLVGVMVDRSALTLRTLTIAAFGVLLLAPQSLVHPSFQMSFAATLALIATYECGVRWGTASADTSIGARVALWGGQQVAALILMSLVAGAATTLYAAFHFHRMAPYGVLANLLGMPIVSAWVMPVGILALLVMPFGFDGTLWWLMGAGIDWMIMVASWVASLPGAVGRVTAFGTGVMLIGSAGLVVICLLKTPLRWAGVLLLAAAVIAAMRAPRPDVLVASDGQSFAVRTTGGRLSIVRGSDSFAVRQWLAADADPRDPNDPSLREGLACDSSGCVGRLADGGLVAIALAPEAFTDDCRRALLVLTPREAPASCGAGVIDRRRWRETGAVALQRTPSGFQEIAARPYGHDRPWTRGPPTTEAVATTTSTRSTARDATPRSEDLGPED